MNYLRPQAYLPFLMFCLFFSCKTEPKKDSIDFKRTDNSVIVRMENDVDQLFPLLGKSAYDGQVYSEIYNSLVGYDPRTQKFVPELLKNIPEATITVTPSGQNQTSFEFEILEQAVWADGSPVTANDYLVSIKTLLNPLVDAGSLRAIIYEEVTDIIVDADNPKKFTVLCKQPSYLTLDNITNVIPVLPAYIIDPKGLSKSISLTDLVDPDKADALAESDENLQEIGLRINTAAFSKALDNITGSGPYVLKAWEPGLKISLEKKENWWGDQISKETHPTLSAFPDKLDYKPITNEATALAAIKLQEIDALSRPNNNEFNALKENAAVNQYYDFKTTTALVIYYLTLNTDAPKLADKRVRQALAYALDIDEVLETVYAGLGERVANPIHPEQPYYNNEMPVIKTNLAKAKSLLTEAGWTDTNNNGIVDKIIEGESVELTIDHMIVGGRETTLNSTLLFKDQAKQVGIDLNIVAVEASVFASKRAAKDFEVMSAGSTITPNWNPRQKWYSNGDANYTNFGTAQTDAMIDEILTTLSATKRNQLYKDLQGVIHEEQPLILLWIPKVPVIVSKRFEYELFSDAPYYEPRFFKLKE